MELLEREQFLSELEAILNEVALGNGRRDRRASLLSARRSQEHLWHGQLHELD